MNVDNFKKIQYSSIPELEDALNNIHPDWKKISADDMTCLVTGFLAFDSNDETTTEYHYAPIYDTCDECHKIEHENRTSFFNAMYEFKSQDKTAVYPCDDERGLMGFVTYPQREYHVIQISNLATQSEKDERKKHKPNLHLNEALREVEDIYFNQGRVNFQKMLQEVHNIKL